MRVDHFSVVALAACGLVACASSGTPDSTDPIRFEDSGVVAPQRNLLLSDLSFGSPGQARAVDEEFDLVVTAFRADFAEDGDPGPFGNGPNGLVRDSDGSETFGSGNTMTYNAALNEFHFEIETDAGSIDQRLYDILLQTPQDILQDNAAVAKFYASGANGFSARWPLEGIDANSNWQSVATKLEEMQDSDNEDEQKRAADLIAAAQSNLDCCDQFLYYYSIPDGYGYYEATKMDDDERPERSTETVAIGSFYEFYDNGEEQVVHLIFGHRTPLGEMPTSGSVDYEGKIVGTVLTNNSIRSLTGSVTMDVNFLTGLFDLTLGTIIREGGNNGNETTFFDYKDLIGSGVISETTFEGSLTEVGGDSVGEFEGAFFGPVANEIGGTFEFGNDVSYASGAFTGKQKDD
ncbi:transferrin-binding protein-like solute binding protein [Parvularcula sp. LCG005]|uniref:transferrin-binding protein-like solute binding protein n=1 Tax=Parvularcula sp. LCG005 TaxID=3078805 RepID=UPI00294256F1|nr:transferrin-binding protein-like solute binding protein [Parvularcula sp. LCG005]WOI53379.1 transferrin-binding protein-like solute binding protein [Parvularcula sp. LCG005]